MAALLQQIDTQKTMSDVPQLYAIARDVAKTLTTDSGLSVSTMLNVAQSMKGLTSKGVQFTQVPVVQDPNDANRVLWQQPQATQLFSAIAHDQSVAKPAKTSGFHPEDRGVRGGQPAAAGIKVLNATATAGLAAQAAPHSARAITTFSARVMPSRRRRARSSSTAPRRTPRRPARWLRSCRAPSSSRYPGSPAGRSS